MSSKFFTWTKGDRKHAAEALRSGGVVPIPVECISFKGLDVSKKPTVGGTRSSLCSSTCSHVEGRVQVTEQTFAAVGISAL